MTRVSTAMSTGRAPSASQPCTISTRWAAPDLAGWATSRTASAASDAAGPGRMTLATRLRLYESNRPA